MTTPLPPGRGLRRRAPLLLVAALPPLLVAGAASHPAAAQGAAATLTAKAAPAAKKAGTKRKATPTPEAKPGTVSVAVRKPTAVRRPPLRTWRLYALDDANAAKGEIAAITDDNEFVTIRVGPETVVSRAGSAASVDNIKHGYTLRCAGGFNKFGDFAAREIRLGATVDDVVLTRKVSLACQKVAGGRGISRASLAAPEPPAPAEKPAEKADDKAPGAPEAKADVKPAEAKPAAGAPAPSEPSPAPAAVP